MTEDRCWCYVCNQEDVAYLASRMILCPTCGNKRCPHASDHREPCSHSNEAGQLGSRYGIWPNPNRPLLDFVQGKN